MIIFPAIDLYEKKAVRLLKGNYAEMTVYSTRPWEIARDFAERGASAVHIVDLEGAKDGTTPNIDDVKKIIDAAGFSSRWAEVSEAWKLQKSTCRQELTV